MFGKLLGGAIVATCLCMPARAEYPERPITMIVPFAPGGGADVMARAVAKSLETCLRQPVVVVNRPGAGGQIGFTALAKAHPDGYTIGVLTAPNLVVFPLQRPTDYKLSDFALIGNLVRDEGMFFVRADSPFKTLAEAVAYARANPGKVTVGTTGDASLPHLATMALERTAGVKFTPVPYGGAAPIRMAILAGNIDMGFVTVADGVADLDAGSVRPLGVTSSRRSGSLPATPTLQEQGYDVIASAFRGLAAPAATPGPVIERLRTAFAEASRDPEFLGIAKKQGMPLEYMGSDAFLAELAREERDYAPMLRRVSEK